MIGERLGLTVPQLRRMNMGEYGLWVAYFKLKNEAEAEAYRKARNG